MRYHIDTIPLWDAIKLNSECPLCAIRRKNELLEVQRYLGASVMEPDTRVEVNDKGFCARHQHMLFEESNRLGHGLMMHTHLKETEAKLDKVLSALSQAAGQAAPTSLPRFFKKNAGLEQSIEDCAKAIDASVSSCILCDSLQENMDRYVYTFHHLWKTDSEFRRAVENSKGFCLPDAAMLLRSAVKELNGEQLSHFAQVMVTLTRDNLKRIEHDIEWFTLKFDYRNQDKPWGESRDAVERTCNKLCGWCVGSEPNPKDA